MSTEYMLYEAPDGNQLWAHEHSSKMDIIINDPQRYIDLSILDLDEESYRKIIIKMIETLSYISSDGAEILKRFNVEYGQTE